MIKMALKDTWIDKRDTTDGTDGDYIVTSDINQIAHAVIELEENPDTYSKDDIDTLLSKKRDNDDFTPIASADNWHEVPREEYEAKIAEQTEAMT